MTSLIRPGLLGLILLAGMSPSVRAAAPTQADHELVAKIAKRLLEKMDPVPGYDVWPPDIRVIESDEVNAWAWIDQKQYKEHGKKVPIIRITVSYLYDVLKRDPQVIALTLGHELGHIHYRHVLRYPVGKSLFVRDILIRENEYEADAFGAELIRKAGFSVIDAVRRKADSVRNGKYKHFHYASLLESKKDHPSWDNRFARVVPNPRVWEVLSTFNNGVALLSSEQFYLACQCFEKVTKFDPNCHEAWLNLGYARLMLYCDTLTAKQLRATGLGHLASTAFYRRAKTLEIKLRDKDARRELWLQAVNALREANRLGGNLGMAKANLGLAYLVHPDGKDVEEATLFFEEALEDLEENVDLTPVERASLYVNLGVAYLAGGARKEGLAQLGQAKKILEGGSYSQDLRNVIRYNEAFALAELGSNESKARAVSTLETYLEDSDPLSVWWSLGYERYATLCNELDRSAYAKSFLHNRHNSTLRMQVMLTLEDGKTVSLTEPIQDVLKRLGKHTAVKLYGKTLRRYRFEKYPVEILATDRVIGIVLASPKSPRVDLRTRDRGKGKSFELRVGMTYGEVLAKLPGAKLGVKRFLLEANEQAEYVYYRYAGVAVRYSGKSKDATIEEIVLVQMP